MHVLRAIGNLRSAASLPVATPLLSRTLVNKAALRPVPPTRGNLSGPIDSPAAFLTAIGRSADTKLNVETWEQLWKMNSEAMRKAGLAVRDRRYILWSMEKYRLGLDPADYAHPPKPKKKIRGRGPRVQNGKKNKSKWDVRT